MEGVYLAACHKPFAILYRFATWWITVRPLRRIRHRSRRSFLRAAWLEADPNSLYSKHRGGRIRFMVLTDTEVRVLGSLIDKEITTPDYYPLSLNALMVACNQSSNRNPVMYLDEATVA